jgi:hypothetical protein
VNPHADIAVVAFATYMNGIRMSTLEKGDRRRQTGDGSRESGDRKPETGEGRIGMESEEAYFYLYSIKTNHIRCETCPASLFVLSKSAELK